MPYKDPNRKILHRFKVTTDKGNFYTHARSPAQARRFVERRSKGAKIKHIQYEDPE